MSFDSSTLHFIQQLKKKKGWKRIQWNTVAKEYLKSQPDKNTKQFRTALRTWYHKNKNSDEVSEPEKPTTKEELRTWIEEYCRGEKNHGEPNTWDVTSVTDMSRLFRGLETFNAPIGQWDTSQVTDMREMFAGATAFNQPLTFTDTSQVTDMGFMFRGATSFNQTLNWDTSQVTDMREMFRDATSFNQTLNWNTSQVTDMSQLFRGATSFNQTLNWDTSQVTTMSWMFMDATAFNQPLNWDTSQVTTMSWMFDGATAFNQTLNWVTSKVTDMSSMFYGAYAFNQPLDWDTSQVTDMESMFYYATAFNEPLDWDTAKVTNMEDMFHGATAFNQPLAFNTSQVTDMSSMFRGATAFNQPLDWDTSQVTDMREMFEGATAMTYSVPFRDITNEVTTALFGDIEDKEAIRKVRVLSAITDDVLVNVFGWTKEDVHKGTILESKLDFFRITPSKINSWNVQKMFLSIAHNMFRRIPVNRVVEVESINPFVHWTRVSTSSNEPFKHKSGKRSKYPTGLTKTRDGVLGVNIAYIIKGYGDKGGSFSTVHPFVVYGGKTCIIKIMEKSADPYITGVRLIKYVNTKDVFELVTQVYLHEALKQHSEWSKRLSVPKIHYVQRVSGSKALHVCMERANGEFMSETEHPWMAIAYIMKALFFLQDKFHFTHRDFHSQNVAYDHVKRRVEIIDFGMACVNPEDNDVAWQSNTSWYPPIAGSNAAKCTNRSYDVCVLLSSLHGGRMSDDYLYFINDIKNDIREKMSQVVKDEIKDTRPVFDLTNFDNFDSPDWTVGNDTDSFHFMYDLIEYPCEDFYPERVLERLLEHIPFGEWSNLRQGWETVFDKIVKSRNKQLLHQLKISKNQSDENKKQMKKKNCTITERKKLIQENKQLKKERKELRRKYKKEEEN